MVWGFGVLLKHLRSYITTSKYIQTDNKDRLIASLEKIHRQLVDAEKRAHGETPVTPEAERKWWRAIRQRKRGMDTSFGK